MGTNMYAQHVEGFDNTIHHLMLLTLAIIMIHNLLLDSPVQSMSNPSPGGEDNQPEIPKNGIIIILVTIKGM